MSKHQVISAIDIGTSKVCTLIAVVEEGGALRVVGASSVQSQGVRKSQIVNLEETSAAITESVDAAERMAGFSIDAAFVSVSGKHIESQNSKGVVAIADPQGDIIQEDISRVIEAARAVSMPTNREILHVVPTSYKVDSQEGIKDPIGMSGVRLEADTHIITASSTVLKNIRKCIEHLGIQVQEFVFSGLASSYATLSDTERELGVALADIGAGTTTLAVFIEGSLVHSNVLPVGALHVTKDIALGSRVSIPGAEKIKIALSHTLTAESAARLPHESREDVRKRLKVEDQLDLQELGLAEDTRYLSKKTLADGIIAPRVKEVFALIRDDLEARSLLSEVPAGIIITGGGADTVGMIEIGKKVLGLPTRVGRPSGVRGLIDEIETPMYATATGLLIYGKSHGNWSPEKKSLFHFSGVPHALNPQTVIESIKKLFKMVMP